MADEQKESSQSISMAGIKLSDDEKKKLMIISMVIMVMFAASILITDYIFGALPASSSAYYPGNCGTPAAGQNIDNCLINYANSTQNASVCSYINDENQGTCYMGVAIETMNPGTCNLISRGDQHYTDCILGLNKYYNSMALCDNLTLFNAQACMYNVSASYNFSNVGICGDLSNSTYAKECTDLYYFRKAQAPGNFGLCSNLQNNLDSSELYFLSANRTNTSQNLLSLVYSSSLNITPSQYCFLTSAESMHNASICSYVTGPFSGTCTYEVQQYNASQVQVDLNANNVSAACGTYTGYSLNICSFKYLSHEALLNKNITYCNMINYSQQADECILAFAFNTSDGSYCSEITNTSIRSICDFIGNYTSNSNSSKV